MVNPKEWKGMKYPDSDLVGLIFRYARPESDGLTAIDAGCATGRHLKLLEDVGYEASGFDYDADMVKGAQDNGFNVVQADAKKWKPLQKPALALCWGFMMLFNEDIYFLRGWDADIIIADWRTMNNTCVSWPGNRKLAEKRFQLLNPGHVLHEQIYLFHDLDECQIPGYERVFWQRSTKTTENETNEWFQTVHKRVIS